MNRKEKAIEFFRKGFNCSQTVLAAFGPELGLPEDECMKIACAFGGGMGRQQYTCGAVTGALMVLGLKYGKGLNDPEEKKKYTYSMVKQFFHEFIKLNGSLNCRELLEGLDMNNPDDKNVINDRNLHGTKCEKYITDSVELLLDLMK